jgi:CRISPR-associated endonuclease/helicase Cas3
MPEAFPTFFTQATGKPEPYAYQSQLAELPCESRLISIPTGLGTTADSPPRSQLM